MQAVLRTFSSTAPTYASGNTDKGYFCTMPENAALQKLLQENEQLFMETLFRNWFPFVCKTIYRIVQDTATAEDLAQDVFIKIWNRRAELQEVYFKAYLHKAAINMALDYVDKKKRRGVHMELGEQHEPVQAENPGAGMNLQQTTQHIQQAVDRLPEKCREIFILSRYEELSYKEIAATLNISVKTVENQMVTALKKLRISLQDYLQVTILFIAGAALYPLLLQF
ncbi:RNA polymerase sigma-70 factor [Chitinophaga sancti]|uniref:RNA polymerase sigma factor n=1 Tax=Chitinophaga sancti TaxID=1004 RepID=UPI002A75C30C|nr:RNA polymerase sigma-70 factor [Chitinophaga sancti]WPQ64632.1 RNA polymerase sigma-70 factor [Chitinophaga sancti]